MRKIKAVAIVLLVLLGIFLLGKDIIAKSILLNWINAKTEAKIDIKDLHIGLIDTLFGVEGLRLSNPADFPDRLMADMPEIYLDYNLGSLIRRKIHIEEMRLNLKKLIVVRNQDGRVNVDSLRMVQAIKEEKARSDKKVKTPGFRIDLLKLKIGKIVFKNYSEGPTPIVREYNVNIDEEFRNITNPYTFINLLAAKSLTKTPAEYLRDFDLGQVKIKATKTWRGAKKAAKRAFNEAVEVGEEFKEETVSGVRETVEKAEQAIKKIFPSKDKK